MAQVNSNTSRTQINTLVVGGGIAGLSLCYFLNKKGVDVKLLEAEARLGGVVGSAAKDGFLLEYGPNSTIATEEILALVSEIGLEKNLLRLPTRKIRKYIALTGKNDKLQPVMLPSNSLKAIFSPVLSFSQKLRILREPWVSRSTNTDESVAEFCCRRFGRGVLDNLVDPFVSGIWAGDPGTLSTRSAFSKLWQLEQEHGSLIRGMIKARSQKRASREIVSFDGGMQQLIDGLSATIPKERISCNIAAKSLSFQGEKVLLESSQNSFLADKIYLCVPAYIAATLLRELLPAGIIERTKLIRYSPVGIMHLAVKNSSWTIANDGYGILIPSRFQKNTLGIIFNSKFFPARAPEQYDLLTVITGGARNPAGSFVNKKDIQDKVLSEVREILAINTAPDIIRTYQYQNAIPSFPLDHHELQNAVVEYHRSQNKIRLLGNWIKGTAFAERIREAKFLADEI